MEDLQRHVAMVHHQANETLLGSLAEKYILEIEEKNSQITELIKQKHSIESQLQNSANPEQIRQLQSDLEALISEYEQVIGERVDKLE